MKRFCAILLLSAVIFLCSCTPSASRNQRIEVRQVFMTQEQILNSIEKETKIARDKIVEKYIWMQYADIDEDPELELLLSFRYELHKGYFFIFDYQNGKYLNVFSRPWPVEMMSQKEVIYASGSDTVHTLTANILQIQKGKVNIIWSGINDKYDYSNLTSGIEIHGRYYLDTNGILNYFYRLDKTNQNGLPIKTDFISEKYIWNFKKNMFLKK